MSTLPLFGALKIGQPPGNYNYTGEEMFQIDPQVKAAECERMIRVIADPERRSVLISLRNLWVMLGSDKSIFDRPRQADPVPNIAQIHAELMLSYKNAMN